MIGVGGQCQGFSGHELGQTPGDGGGTGKPSMLQSLGSQGHEELDMTWQMNNNNKGEGRALQVTFEQRAQEGSR